jgi:hypothetical protein
MSQKEQYDHGEIPAINDQLVLVVGYSATGKSASLRNITNQDRWMYLGTEAGKRLPFKNKFQTYRIDDPYQVHEAFDFGTDNKDIDGIILDSITFLMDMFETQYVLTAGDTMKAWSNYAQFFKLLLQKKVTLFDKPVVITAHLKDELDEKAMEIRTSVPIKGALKNNGVESYFSTVVAAKRIVLKDLEEYSSNLLTITDEDKDLGYKHVFQTRLTKKSIGERIRSPMGLFSKNQTYMDNDSQILLDHLYEFYK